MITIVRIKLENRRYKIFELAKLIDVSPMVLYARVKRYKVKFKYIDGVMHFARKDAEKLIETRYMLRGRPRKLN